MTLKNHDQKLMSFYITKVSEKKNVFLNEEGLLITDLKRVADKFNYYFFNISQILLKDMEETSNQYQDYLINPNEHSVFLKE